MGPAMAKVVELRPRGAASPGRGTSVACANCGERHPLVRLVGGKTQYPTAFPAGELWFCRHRGCQAAFQARMPTQRR